MQWLQLVKVVPIARKMVSNSVKLKADPFTEGKQVSQAFLILLFMRGTRFISYVSACILTEALDTYVALQIQLTAMKFDKSLT